MKSSASKKQPKAPGKRSSSATLAAGIRPLRSGGVFKSAAVEVLRRQQTLLSTGEICRLALEWGLLRCSGKTPEATMASCLYSDIKRYDTDSLFVRPQEGMFGLREWLVQGCIPSPSHDSPMVSSPKPKRPASSLLLESDAKKVRSRQDAVDKTITIQPSEETPSTKIKAGTSEADNEPCVCRTQENDQPTDGKLLYITDDGIVEKTTEVPDKNKLLEDGAPSLPPNFATAIETLEKISIKRAPPVLSNDDKDDLNVDGAFSIQEIEPPPQQSDKDANDNEKGIHAENKMEIVNKCEDFFPKAQADKCTEKNKINTLYLARMAASPRMVQSCLNGAFDLISDLERKVKEIESKSTPYHIQTGRAYLLLYTACRQKPLDEVYAWKAKESLSRALAILEYNKRILGQEMVDYVPLLASFNEPTKDN